ncbi:undecaprenyl-diphosphate phosphatase [Alicyclobacillus macrosporangiidus]|uniref:Undecaprenyl-diphosphatase n=1 Tax=Alicyclobacillus macrosporangiidus TaxID=392015 RepID=A0A1I7KUA4_9BACL|nr:undecaprenyl-diphosphate phosphatase [Alicyclobacillus macrosporangiidus]SFV00987.1 undecaprenyl-diphosphatase [Alicyclobacillus macrosporangiidus]
MTDVQAIVLGVVQGVTEFLPISSSGHLVLLQKLWHISGDSLLFITFVHVGTLVAVVWAFRREVGWLIRSPWSWTARMILLALVPTAMVGALFEELFENLFASGVTLGMEFVVTGILLWWMDTVPAGEKTEQNMRPADALWVGTLQGMAILPALSRSGLTMAAALWRGMGREAAGRFSFLLSIPAILGATLVELTEMLERPAGGSAIHWGPMVIGAAAASVAGYASVKLTLWLLRRARMKWFAWYVWILAEFVFIDQLFHHRWFPPLW